MLVAVVLFHIQDCKSYLIKTVNFLVLLKIKYYVHCKYCQDCKCCKYCYASVVLLANIGSIVTIVSIISIVIIYRK